MLKRPRGVFTCFPNRFTTLIPKAIGGSMKTLAASLSDLLVNDLMHPCITVSDSAELAQAAKVMREHQVNCLPVVDAQERCVGIISASDFVTRFAERADPTCPLAGHDMIVSRNGPNHSLLLTEEPQDYVRSRMTPAVQTVAADTPLLKAAHHMSKARLHHFVVLDKCSRPVGMISSLDIVDAVVNCDSANHRTTVPSKIFN